MSTPSKLERTLGRWVARLFSPAGKRGRLVVFCYHQVLADKDPLRPGEPTLAEFESDLERIGQWFNVLPLPAASAALADGSLPPAAACITFDDGYLNNYELAAPALERHGLTATFFITSGAVEQGVMWNDLIIDGVAACSGPINLLALGEHAPKVTPQMTPRETVREIIAAIKYLPLESRWEMARRFYRDNAGGDLPRKMMAAGQVGELAARGFDIGAHTVSHPILAKLDDDAAQREIEASVQWVTEVTGTAPASFAYPNGRPGVDFEPVHVRQAEAAGCAVAVTTEWAIGNGNVNRYRIPRVGPWWRAGRGGVGGLLRVYAKNWLTG